MSVGEGNSRIIITVSKDLREEIENLAKEDKRSISNYVNKVLDEHVKCIRKKDTQ